MPKRITTDAMAARLKPPKKSQVAHFVAGYPGLCLRLSYHGTRAWLYCYRFQGRQRRFVLGWQPGMNLGQAQDAWRVAREQLRKGIDPARPVAAAPAHTFKTALEDWMQRDQAGNRSAAETNALICRACASWLDWDIASIGRAECLAVLDSVVDSGRIGTARRLHRHLHRLFRWCQGRGIIAINPMAAMDMPGAAVKRERVFSDIELKALWRAAGNLDAQPCAVVRLLILTGARSNEIAALRWQWVDIEAREIRIPSSDIKNKEPHVIPLTDAMLDIITALPRLGAFVFGQGGETRFRNWSKIKPKMLAAMEAEMPAWQWRDIRRSVRTGLSRLQVPYDVREAVIGHKRQGLDAVYDHYDFLPEKRAALEKWGRYVARIVADKPATVVALYG